MVFGSALYRQDFMQDSSFRWLLDDFPASLVCRCALVFPGAFPSKVCFYFGYSSVPVVGYAGLAFVPHVSSGIMWGPLLVYVLMPGFPPLGSYEAVYRFSICNCILGPFDHVFGSLHCLNFVHSFLYRFFLSHPL